MTDVSRRVILKPSAATAERVALLGDALRAAVQAQSRLAAECPYILRPSGTLEEDELGFFFAHEPAKSLVPEALFDAEAPVATVSELRGALTALCEALACAHAGGGGRPVLHGGLCPGTVLLGEDGLFKVTDFGVAPAICKAFGVDSYLNLANGPRPDSSGSWESLDPYVIDRDDRLCGFVDPDKYGSEALTSFEAGSDVIAAGMILWLMAEHRHPYLHFEPEAHRVVDMARTMGFGVPGAWTRAELYEATDDTARRWTELVSAMVARLPAKRPSARQLSERFGSAALGIDLDAVRAQRWLTQLESMLAAGLWNDLAAVMEARPKLKTWPAELEARAAELETRVREGLATEGQRAAVEASLQAAARWFTRLQAAVRGQEWDAARELLREKPVLEHWPEDVLAELEPLTTRIEQAGAEKKARAWQKLLQKSFEAGNWLAVEKLLAQRPALASWPEDLQEAVAGVEAAFETQRAEREQHARQVAEQHDTLREWLNQAKALAKDQCWAEAIEVLAEPPTVEHWPADVAEEADELATTWRLSLAEAAAARLEAITEQVRQAGAGLAAEVVRRELADLLAPDRVETGVEFVDWASPNADAYGRARLEYRLSDPTDEQAVHRVSGELDFRLVDEVVEVCGGRETLQKTLAGALKQQLVVLQRAQLRTLEHKLRTGQFPDAAIDARLEKPQSQLSVDVALLGPKVAEGRHTCTLSWSGEAAAWELADVGQLSAAAIEMVAGAARDAAWKDLLQRSALLRPYGQYLALHLETSASAGQPLPERLSLDARVVFRSGGEGPEHELGQGRVVSEHAGEGVLEANVRALEATFASVLVGFQDMSRRALEQRLKDAASAMDAQPRIKAPSRSKTLVETLSFALRPKRGGPVELRAAWNARTLAYEFPAGWEESLASQAGAAPDVAGESQGTEAVPAARSLRGGMFVGVAVAVMVAAAGGLYFGLNGRGSGARPEVPPSQTTKPVMPPAEQTAAPRIVETPPSEQPSEIGPTEPSVAEVPRETVTTPSEAPATEKPADLVGGFRAYMRSQPARFGAAASVADLVRALVPESVLTKAGSTLPARIEFLVAATMPGTSACEDLQSAGDDRVTFTVGAMLRDGEQLAPQTFVMDRAENGWRPVAENVAALEAMANAARDALVAAVEAARDKTEQSRDAGRLADVHAAYDQVRDILPVLSNEPAAKAFADVLATTPPTWSQVAGELEARGYTAAESRDPGTDYPRQLTDRQGHTLLLVSVSPGADLWHDLAPRVDEGGPLHADVASSSGERPWRVYYVDEAELGAAPDFDHASTLAEGVGRTLPTRDEWLLAALQMRAALPSDLLGGLREWCSDGTTPDTRWLCGGSTHSVAGTARVLPPPPIRPQGLNELWVWLNSPLVLQERSVRFGDESAGVRSVLRVWPR